MILVDAGILDTGIFCIRISGCPRADPVVKEIELDAGRRNGVWNDCVFQRVGQSGAARRIRGQSGRKQ